jgi:hypothetical protein
VFPALDEFEDKKRKNNIFALMCIVKRVYNKTMNPIKKGIMFRKAIFVLLMKGDD